MLNFLDLYSGNSDLQQQMAQDLMSRFYTCLNLPVEDRLRELARIIDQSTPNKELQAFFPQLITNIFTTSFSNGWNLKTVTCDVNRREFDALINFLEPQGPMFRLCYKLLSEPQLKYDLPLSVLPLDLQMTLERGRCPQFYADLLVVDSQSLNIVALALNPFDYYIFNYALHLMNSGQHQNSWENWNSVYFALACDYLMHFLPSDPNVPVLPHITNFSGKVPMAAPLQTANRPLVGGSLLLIPDLCGISNQHASPQTQSRNEVWRSETVLQVLIDIWMSVDQFCPGDVQVYQRPWVGCGVSSSPERVRIVRVLIKHIHSFTFRHMIDPASRSSALRKYARQIMCAKAYRYVKHLVTTWPLDASFRLVLELWLSLIQPWRYTDSNVNQDRLNKKQEEGTGKGFEPSYIQFIAENFPTYTCIFQLVLPRFMRLDLTAYKNAIMLFRVGKVFSQEHLTSILWNLERAITDNNHGCHHSQDSYNNATHDHSYNGAAIHKWVAVAKQAIAELNLAANFNYDPIWGDNQTQCVLEFIKKILSAKQASENVIIELTQNLKRQNQGLWASMMNWLMIGVSYEDEMILEECKKVPVYLNSAVHYFSVIFGLNEDTLVSSEPAVCDSALEHSSFVNSSSFPLMVTNKLRAKTSNVHYMGDPDLMPITSYESTILVRIMYQIASKINEMFGEEFSRLWNRTDFLGYAAREILESPCTIRTYVKDVPNQQNLVVQELPARLSLRKFGSHSFVVWATIGYLLFKLFSYSGLHYVFFLFTVWMMFVLIKAVLKMLKFMRVDCNCT